MARGRKQQGEERRSEVVSFRITDRQKEVLTKNKWVKEDLKKQIDDYLNHFLDS